MEQLLVRPEEAARALGIAQSRLDRMLRDGEIPFILIGNKKRIPADALRRFIEVRFSSGVGDAGMA